MKIAPSSLLAARVAARYLKAFEVSVDDRGYAHDDEGNSWYVGRQYAGETYLGPHLPPYLQDSGHGHDEGPNPSKVQQAADKLRHDMKALSQHLHGWEYKDHSPKGDAPHFEFILEDGEYRATVTGLAGNTQCHVFKGRDYLDGGRTFHKWDAHTVAHWIHQAEEAINKEKAQ